MVARNEWSECGDACVCGCVVVQGQRSTWLRGNPIKHRIAVREVRGNQEFGDPTLDGLG